MAAQGAPGRNEEIEVLRALAALMVLIQHLPRYLFPWHSRFEDFSSRYWHGAAGVDVFFAISGFVITRNLLPRLETCCDSTSKFGVTMTFLLRRFWRLQPSAWLWIAVPLSLCVTFNRSGAFHPLGANLPAAVCALLDIANLRLGLMGGSGDPGVVSPYWSLSFEEQFYVALPILALLLRQRLALLMFALLAFQFTMSLGPLILSTRPGALAIGVLLAIWSGQPGFAMAEPKFLSASPALRMTLLGGALAAAGMLESELPAPLLGISYGVVALISGALVYAASFNRGYVMPPGPTRRALVWVGTRSYAIYLVHIPAFALTRELVFRLAPSLLVTRGLQAAYLTVAAVLILVMSDLNYRVIEVPGRRYGRSLHIMAPTVA